MGTGGNADVISDDKEEVSSSPGLALALNARGPGLGSGLGGPGLGFEGLMILDEIDAHVG